MSCFDKDKVVYVAQWVENVVKCKENCFIISIYCTQSYF